MIDTSSTTTETWAKRVEAWRASGKRAEEFSRHETDPGPGLLARKTPPSPPKADVA